MCSKERKRATCTSNVFRFDSVNARSRTNTTQVNWGPKATTIASVTVSDRTRRVRSSLEAASATSKNVQRKDYAAVDCRILSVVSSHCHYTANHPGERRHARLQWMASRFMALRMAEMPERRLMEERREMQVLKIAGRRRGVITGCCCHHKDTRTAYNAGRYCFSCKISSNNGLRA
jgi:hypothetical protein